MEDHITKWIMSGLFFWTSTFLLFRFLLPAKFSNEFCTRLVATVHATTAVVLATLSVKDWSCPLCPLASDSTPWQMKSLAVTLAYMIYDLICCQFVKKVNTVDNAVHHIVSIVGIGSGLAYRKCGTEMVASLWITEISTPFLHTREFLKELGVRDTGLNLTVDILFAAIFSCARMLVGPYIVYKTVTAPNPLLIKAMAVGLQLVSAFWFYKILRMVRFKLQRWLAKPAGGSSNGKQD